MFVIGIDPGINGAAACLDCEYGEPPFICDAIDLPTMPDGKSGKRQINERGLAEWFKMFRQLNRRVIVVIENVRAMPAKRKGQKDRAMGVASSFRFGMAAGQLRATVRLVLGIEPVFAEPAVWKGWYALPGGDKEAARQLALKLFPESGYLLTRKLDHQRAEAMLLARWAMRPIIGR